MIISASRRTDIPAFYSEWFLNRLQAGYVYVRNPMNIHQISNISLSPSVVDCIVFWSKNPLPLLKRLDCLQQYCYYFQYTLNGYDRTIEPFIPSLDRRIETFVHLSTLIGADRVVWRYDPIFVNEHFDLQWHIECFSYIAALLQGHTRRCVISLVDVYPRILKNIAGLHISEPALSSVAILADKFSQIAASHDIELYTCAEEVDLSQFGIEHGHCIDGTLISQLVGIPLKTTKDKMQRDACGCVSSIDIGAYNTCLHGCAYCYANHNRTTVNNNQHKHDPMSPLLLGSVGPDDVVRERKVESLKDEQMDLFGNRPDK